MTQSRLRIGTRASALARWQAHWVAAQLAALGIEAELIPMTTRGDAHERDAIANIGAPGVFTKELERALVDGQIDLAVHSLKDLPTDVVPGLAVVAVPKRESPFDVLVSRHGTLDQLPPGSVIGTGSLRAVPNCSTLDPDLRMRDVRGNVDTRLEKLAAGQYDALVLAHAGLVRLGMQHQITQVFEPDVMLPAVGQGALAIEARGDDARAGSAVARLNHDATHRAVRAERALLAALNGGCLAPIGAWARELPDAQLRLDAVVLAADGSRRIAAQGTARAEDGAALGADVAARLLAQGAAELIQNCRATR